MANQEQLEALRRGVKFWNTWRLKSFGYRDIDLSNADFSYMSLRAADFCGAYLAGARFCSSDLIGANFLGAQLNQTIFVNVDLSKSYGLEEIRHWGKSYLDMTTLRAFRGKLPLKFLRGCGLSDLQIEFSKLLNPGLDSEQVTDITYEIHQIYMGDGVQYYSCFISFNNKDQEFAQKLHDDLQNKGVRCWFAPEDMKIGEQIRPKIDQEIRIRDKLLVILSENSIKSEWVGDEVEAALEEENASQRAILFPLRLDDTVLNSRGGWTAKIKRSRHIGDFSNWQNKASYQKAFEALLRDLKATEGIANGQ
jgi:hypothetical protein